MVKYLIIISALCMLAHGVYAQNFRRTQKSPGFFIPQQTLNSMYRQERLPDVENMQVDGKQAPIIQEMREKAAQEAERKRLAEIEAKKKQEELAKKRQAELEQQKLREAQEAKQKAEREKALRQLAEREEAEKRKTSAAPTPPQAVPVPEPLLPQTSEPVKPMFADKPKQQPKPETNTASQQPAKMPSLLDFTAPKIDANLTYDDLIREYQEDTLNISKNIPVKNERLEQMLQDYRNIDHKI